MFLSFVLFERSTRLPATLGLAFGLGLKGILFGLVLDAHALGLGLGLESQVHGHLRPWTWFGWPWPSPCCAWRWPCTLWPY